MLIRKPEKITAMLLVRLLSSTPEVGIDVGTFVGNKVGGNEAVRDGANDELTVGAEVGLLVGGGVNTTGGSVG